MIPDMTLYTIYNQIFYEEMLKNYNYDTNLTLDKELIVSSKILKLYCCLFLFSSTVLVNHPHYDFFLDSVSGLEGTGLLKCILSYCDLKWLKWHKLSFRENLTNG